MSQNSPNPFVRTRSMCSGQEEDHLTEFVAAALDTCEQFRVAYGDFLLSEYARIRGWGTLRIDSVETQVNYGGKIPDLVLRLLDGKGKQRSIAIEHKIFAKESRRSRRSTVPSGEVTEEEVDGQLERYLSLPDVDGVAYVRVWPQSLNQSVVQHEKYIKPPQGMHFLWWHFYPILKETSCFSPVVAWLREGFELDGMTPPPKHISPLYVPDNPDQEIANRGDFAKLLELAAVRAAEAGWRPNFDQHGAELYLKRHPHSWAERVLFSGIGMPKKGMARQPGFRVWVTPRVGEEAVALDRLLPVLESGSLPRGLELFQLPNGTVELWTALSELLSGADDAESIRDRFASVATAFLACL
jgi:hypothetical protein